MSGIVYRRVHCPYCGEAIELQVDDSTGEQDYIEDCSICCRPIEVGLRWTGQDWDLEVRRDDD